MVMDTTDSTIHEGKLIAYMTLLLSIAQFVTRITYLNGMFTTFLISGAVSYYSTLWHGEEVLPLNLANSLARAATDIIGFLTGIVLFLVLLLVTSTKLVFTSDDLLTLLTGGGISIGSIFLTLFLTYASNMSLFSSSRFFVNLGRIPTIPFFNGGNNNGAARGRARARANPRRRGR